LLRDKTNQRVTGGSKELEDDKVFGVGTEIAIK